MSWLPYRIFARHLFLFSSDTDADARMHIYFECICRNTWTLPQSIRGTEMKFMSTRALSIRQFGIDFTSIFIAQIDQTVTHCCGGPSISVISILYLYTCSNDPIIHNLLFDLLITHATRVSSCVICSSHIRQSSSFPDLLSVSRVYCFFNWQWVS